MAELVGTLIDGVITGRLDTNEEALLYGTLLAKDFELLLRL